jgi:hypothetical protein
VVLVENGTTYIAQGFANTGLIQLTSVSASLSGGAIASSGSIKGQGQVGNDLVNSGTIEAIGGILALGGDVTNGAGGLVTAGSGAEVLMTSGLASNAGQINLNGGTFDNNNHTLVSSGQISGHGILRTGGLTNAGSMTLTGGTVTVNGAVTNQAGSQVEVIGQTALFADDFTNFGIFKNTGANVSFAATYTENGTYISDPADNRFLNILLGETGALVGGAGDRFFVSGDLMSASQSAEAWETLAAELIFESGSAHTLAYTGVDRGARLEGLLDNYAWGMLSLGAGDTLQLEDGDSTPGGALYVRVLDLAGGLAQLSSLGATGMNMYYDPRWSENDYLGGQSYALAGGGTLAPIPEPGTGTLLTLGLAGLAWRGRHRCGRAGN